MNKLQILNIINLILEKQGKPPIKDENVSLRDINFRSLDFSELAIRIERSVSRELVFDASQMRSIKTINDVIEFFHTITNENHQR